MSAFDKNKDSLTLYAEVRSTKGSYSYHDHVENIFRLQIRSLTIKSRISKIIFGQLDEERRLENA